MESEVPIEADRSTRDARSLVEQMVAAGEWPGPEIMERIVAAGDEAVDPLLEILATNPRGWPAEAPLDHAIGLLGEIHPPRALPALVDVIRRYKGDSGNSAADAIARFGEEGFGTLLGLIVDPDIVGFQRAHLIETTKSAARSDPEKLARLAEFLRRVFGDVAAAAREERNREAEPDLHDSHGRDDPDEEAVENALSPVEALSFLASDLSDMADPPAREMIQAAFDEGLLDTSIIDVGSVKQDYEAGGRPARELAPWLEEYREHHEDELDRRRRLAEMRPINFPARSSYPDLTGVQPEPWPSPAPPSGPIRKASATIGRNDPCWCGSGKKYKKCHLGKDAPS